MRRQLWNKALYANIVIIIATVFIAVGATASAPDTELIQPLVELTEEERTYLANLGPITMAVDPDWVPYEQLDDQGNFTGIAADLVELVAQRLGIEFKIIPTSDWAETLAISQAGECLVIPFLNQTPVREEWLTFTETLYADITVIVTRNEHPFVSELSELTNKTVVLPVGTSIEERVSRDFPNLNVLTTESEQAVLEMVDNRQADMTLRSLAIVAYTIREQGYISLKIAGRVPEYTNYLRMGVLKSEPMLRDILNKGIETITNQEREEITNRHIYIKIEENNNYIPLIQILGLITVITIVLLFIQFNLRKQHERTENLRQEAEAAKEHFQTIFQTTPNPILITTLEDFKIIDYNQAFLINSGYNDEDIAAERYESVHLYTNAPVEKEHIRQELEKNGFVNNVVIELQNKYMERQIGEISAKLFIINEKKFAINVIRDITSSKLTEQKLVESERRMNLVLENSPVGIIDYNPAGKIVTVNSEFCRILGITKEQVEKLDMLELPNKEITACIEKALAGEKGNYEGMYQSYLSGKEVMIRATFAPMLNESNEILGGIAIVEDFTDRKRLEQEIYKLSITDKLTQLNNRLMLDEFLEQEIARSQRSGVEFSVIITDIDRFKLVNDNHGHHTGDLVLKEFALILKSSVRESDVVGRWGGEEFLMILPDTEMHGATALAEKIRKEVEEYTFTGGLKITSSFGVTASAGDMVASSIVSKADVALYQAKRNGRNQVVSH